MRTIVLAFVMFAAPALAQTGGTGTGGIGSINQCKLCSCCGMPIAGQMSVIEPFRHGKHHAFSGMR